MTAAMTPNEGVAMVVPIGGGVWYNWIMAPFFPRTAGRAVP